MADEPRVVEAVGIAVHSQHRSIGEYVEKAMSDAVHRALAEGVAISDSDEISRRMNEAKDKAYAELGIVR